MVGWCGGMGVCVCGCIWHMIVGYVSTHSTLMLCILFTLLPNYAQTLQEELSELGDKMSQLSAEVTMSVTEV